MNHFEVNYTTKGDKREARSEAVIDALREIDKSAIRMDETTWIVSSSRNQKQIGDLLKNNLVREDFLEVAKLAGPIAVFGCSQAIIILLENKLGTANVDTL